MRRQSAARAAAASPAIADECELADRTACRNCERGFRVLNMVWQRASLGHAEQLDRELRLSRRDRR
jgi:hypothetical protein